MKTTQVQCLVWVFRMSRDTRDKRIEMFIKRILFQMSVDRDQNGGEEREIDNFVTNRR